MGIKTLHINKHNLGKVLVNNKIRKDKTGKSGAHKLKCNDTIYISENGRKLIIRKNDNRKSITDDNRCTGIAMHYNDNNHMISDNI